MKKILLAGLALGALALGAPAATADPGHFYAGGCGFTTVNDTTPNQALGGRKSWNGEISILARSTNGGSPARPTASPIEVRCDLYENGTLFQYAALEAAGRGVAARAARLQFHATDFDVISVCEYVAVGFNAPTYHCEDATTTPRVPEPVEELIGTVIDTLNNEVFAKIGPTHCPLIGAAAGTYGPVTITAEGDVFLFGGLWRDCPPYATAP